jgi:hypothetical protein
MIAYHEPQEALWSSKEEISSKSWGDWIASHTSFCPPLHHNKGEIFIYATKITLIGKHVSNDEDCQVEIPKRKIKSVRVGFDDTYRRRDDHGLGIVYQPLIITFLNAEGEQTVYICTQLNRITRASNNNEWCEFLTETYLDVSKNEKKR